MPNKRPTILIADDHRPLARAVRRHLSADFDVVASVFDGEGLVEVAAELTPDLLLVDIAMPDISGIEAVARLRSAGNTAYVVMLTMHEDEEYVEQAMHAGAQGYVSKNRMASDLIPAIRKVLAGGTFVSTFR